MPHAEVELSVMQIGRDQQIVRDTIAALDDLRNSLSKLLGVPVDRFRASDFRASSSPEVIDFLERLANIVLQMRSAPLDVLHFLFFELAPGKHSDVEKVLARARYLDTQVEDELIRSVFEHYLHARSQSGWDCDWPAPQIVWLPRKSLRTPPHGISHQSLEPGQGMLLWSDAFYPQIVWHEALHLCFRCEECYDEMDKKPTCDCGNCVMQWEPCNSDPSKGTWLCDRQKKHIVD
jgi:hypothetical protein